MITASVLKELKSGTPLCTDFNAKLIGNEIYDRLLFNKHVKTFCRNVRVNYMGCKIASFAPAFDHCLFACICSESLIHKFC